MGFTLEELREQSRSKKGVKGLKDNKPTLSQVETPKIAFNKSSMLKAPNIKIKKDEIDGCFIIIPDVHSYERDVQAYEIAMEAIKVISDDYPVKKFVQLGDLMECGEMSSHPPSHVNEIIPPYADEVDWAVNDFWARVMKSCPKDTSFHALLGNHEHRVSKKLLDRLGRGDTTRSLYEHLMPTDIYKNMGIDVTQYGTEDERDGMLDLFPELVCVHGWSFSENAAAVHASKIGNKSILFGHIHRAQQATRRLAGTNQLIVAQSFGALAKNNLYFQKAVPTNHSLGMGMVLTCRDSFSIIHMPITGNHHKQIALPNGVVLST